jgi:hypothetical protein
VALRTGVVAGSHRLVGFGDGPGPRQMGFGVDRKAGQELQDIAEETRANEVSQPLFRAACVRCTFIIRLISAVGHPSFLHLMFLGSYFSVLPRLHLGKRKISG